MKNVIDYKKFWFTTESLKEFKCEIRTIDSIGELSELFNEIYQDLYAAINKDYIDPETGVPYKGNDEYRFIIKQELNRLKKILNRTKKYMSENNLKNHPDLLYIVIDQILDLHYEVGIRYKNRLKLNKKNNE